MDLAKGHVKALKKIEENPGLAIYNLGTGKGYSVLDIVKNFEAATGVKIPYVSNLAEQEILQLVIVMHLRQKKSLTGKQKTVSVICVKIPGDGSLIIRRDMKNRMYI